MKRKPIMSGNGLNFPCVIIIGLILFYLILTVGLIIATIVLFWKGYYCTAIITGFPATLLVVWQILAWIKW